MVLGGGGSGGPWCVAGDGSGSSGGPWCRGVMWFMIWQGQVMGVRSSTICFGGGGVGSGGPWWNREGWALVGSVLVDPKQIISTNIKFFRMLSDLQLCCRPPHSCNLFTKVFLKISPSFNTMVNST